MDFSVEINDLNKKYGSKQVLDHIHLDIERGKIYGLIGPSGAGKTTLVKMVVGMDVADSGDVHVLGKKMPNLEILQRLGYMAQSDALYTNLTGTENLSFFASLFRLSKAQKKERMMYVANLVNLTDELNKKVSAYSGGMKRRLSLAIALIQDPEILILDEPTVGIDPELRLSIWNELIRLKKEEKKTILVTTHVMDEAEKCDFVVMIRDGKMIKQGTPEELMKNDHVDKLEAVFLRAGRGSHEN